MQATLRRLTHRRERIKLAEYRGHFPTGSWLRLSASGLLVRVVEHEPYTTELVVDVDRRWWAWAKRQARRFVSMWK